MRQSIRTLKAAKKMHNLCRSRFILLCLEKINNQDECTFHKLSPMINRITNSWHRKAKTCRLLRYSHRKTRLIVDKSAVALDITSGAIDCMDHGMPGFSLYVVTDAELMMLLWRSHCGQSEGCSVVKSMRRSFPKWHTSEPLDFWQWSIIPCFPQLSHLIDWSLAKTWLQAAGSPLELPNALQDWENQTTDDPHYPYTDSGVQDVPCRSMSYFP